MAFVSAVNQPERVFCSSQDDAAVNNTNALTWNSFQITLPTPILAPKRAQLLRASIPNVVSSSFPNYQIVFWYYRKDTTNPFADPELKNLRFFPSNYVGSSFGCPINRVIANYQDLVEMLNTAAAAADSLTYNPYHTANDVSFAYDAVTRKISMTGLTPNYSYTIAGYEDPAVNAAMPNVVYSFNGVVGDFIGQPYVPFQTMNLRVGFGLPGNMPLSTQTFVAAGTPIVADSFADLVYSQNVIIRCNIIAASCLSSSGLHDAICVMPVANPPLYVSQYTSPMVNWLTKVKQELYEITFVLLDDNSQPYELPNNAIVNIELGFGYT